LSQYLFFVFFMVVEVISVKGSPPSSPTYVDVPFPQLNSTIYQFPNYKPVAAWYSLPSEFSDDLIQDIAYSSDVALVLGSSSLWFFKLDTMTFARADTLYSLSIKLGSKVLLTGSTLLVIAPGKSPRLLPRQYCH